MSYGISVVVPTIGRSSLAATLRSLAPQVTELDEVHVLFDGPEHDDRWHISPSWTRGFLEVLPCDSSVTTNQTPLEGWGHPLRNYALDMLVTRTRVMTMDDDDVYTDGAFDAIRAELDAHPPAVHVFGCRWGPGHPAAGVVLPRGRGLMMGEIATPMVVAPSSLARYGDAYDGDWTYAQNLAAIFPADGWVWHDHVICEVRPMREGVAAS